jgi:hypothetical protein
MAPEKPRSIRSLEEVQRAMADCERRINEARAIALARNDGVVPALMTDLEREWLTLARTDAAKPS